MMPQPGDPVAVQLIANLNDPDASEGDQGDAAIDLEYHSGAWFEQAIFEILRREGFTSVLAQMCAESLAGIWAREGRIDKANLRSISIRCRERAWSRLSRGICH